MINLQHMNKNDIQFIILLPVWMLIGACLMPFYGLFKLIEIPFKFLCGYYIEDEYVQTI